MVKPADPNNPLRPTTRSQTSSTANSGPQAVARPAGAAMGMGTYVRSARSQVIGGQANEYRQAQVETQKTYADIELAAHKSFNAHLANDHPVKAELETILFETAKKLGINPQQVSINIFKSGESIEIREAPTSTAMSLPDAFINPGNGNIYISDTMLEVMDYRTDLLRAVIAHELGHFISAQNSLEEFQNYDPLEHKITSYEEEYYCDRIASIANSLFQEDTTAISEVLTRLEAAQESFCKKYNVDILDSEKVAAVIHRSHPYSSRRIKANHKLARMLGKRNTNTTTHLSARLDDTDFPQTLYEKCLGLASKAKVVDGEVVVDTDDLNYKAEQVLRNHGGGGGSLSLPAREEYKARELEDYREIVFTGSLKVRSNQRKLEKLGLKDTITSLDELETFMAQQTTDPEVLDQQTALRKIFISSNEEYYPEAEAADINDLVEAGLNQDSKQEFNDFFTELITYFSYHQEHKLEAVEELHAQIGDLSQNSLETFLRNFSQEGLIADVQQSPQRIIHDKTFVVNSDIFSNMIVDQWIQTCQEEGSSQLDILKQYFALSKANEIENGPNIILRNSSSIAEIIAEEFSKANTSDKKAIIDILNSNPDFSSSLLNCHGRYIAAEDRIENPFLRSIEDFCKSEDIFFSLSKTSITKSDLQKDVDKISNIRKVTLNATPEINVNLKKQEGDLSIEHNWDGPNCEITIYFNDQDSLDSGELDSELRSILAEKDYINLYEAIGEEYSRIQRVDGTSDHYWVSNILKAAEEIESNANSEEKKNFLRSELSSLEAGSLSQRIMFARNASLSNSRDKILDMSVDDYILLHGHDKYVQEYFAEGRNQYNARAYADAEKDIYTMTQIWDMWQEGFAQEFSNLSPGKDKLDFLLETQPIKSLSRDQKIAEAIGYPELGTWQDIAEVKKALEAETDLELILKLRDSFLNPVLVSFCEVQLHQKIGNNFDTSKSSEIQELIAEQPSFKNDSELMRILFCFNSKSSLRDELLKPLIDRQNSSREKELLSRFTTEPTTVDIKKTREATGTVQTESFLDVLSKSSAQDKAEVLLYFLGKRDFQSIDLINSDDLIGRAPEVLNNPDARSYLNHEATYVVDHNIVNIDAAELVKYQKPDALVRLLKVIGMDDDVLQDTLDSVSSNSEQIEALTEILSGEEGILSDKEAREFFFKEAAETIVNNSSSDLGNEKQKQAIKGLIEFTLKECPSEKLPGMFKNLWNLSRTQNITLAQLSSEILQNLGPAFIKFGQKLATMNIPAEFKTEFRKLSSQNTVADTTFFYHYLQANGLGDHFEESESGAKIGEGSMAASYKAKALADSKAELKSDPQNLQRAVKVIHPFIESEIDTDIEFITKLVSYMNDHSQDFGGLAIPENTPEIIRQRLIKQADPQLEIEKAQIMADNLEIDYDNLQFQAVKIDHSRSKGLVISSHYRPGLELDSTEIDQAGLNGQEIRNKVGIEVLRQILQADAYQSDPNLGNFGLLIDEESGKSLLDAKSRAQVTWYDSGSIEDIAKDDQKTLLSLIKAIATNSNELPAILNSLVNSDTDLSSEIQTWLGSLDIDKDQSALETAKTVFESFTDFIAQKGMQIDDKWISIADTLGMLSPLLDGADPDTLKALVTDSLKKANLLSTAERLALRFLNL